jgi:hypothetical protein
MHASKVVDTWKLLPVRVCWSTKKYDDVKLPVFSIVFLQIHIHGTNCVWYYFWFHSEDNTDIEIQYY